MVVGGDHAHGVAGQVEPVQRRERRVAVVVDEFAGDARLLAQARHLLEVPGRIAGEQDRAGGRAGQDADAPGGCAR